MTIVDVRRHSNRAKPGPHLSREGVARARRLGEGHPPVDLVVTSPLPRAVETAVAMGFSVDGERRELSEMADAVGDIVAWDAGFAPWAAAVTRGGAAAELARVQAAVYADVARGLPPGGRGLVVSHGGIVEAGAVGAVPDQDLSPFGAPLGCLEGVRLHWDGASFIRAEILRAG